LHIVITTLWFPHDKNPLYGIFIKAQAIALADHVDVTVLVTRRKLIPSQKEYKIGKVNVIEKSGPYLPNTSEKRLKKWTHYYFSMFEIANARKKVDLIHCHDYIALFPTREINKKYGIRYVTTIHNTDFLRDKVSAWRKPYISEGLQASAKVISVGNSLSQKLTSYVHEDRIVNIPNIVDTDLFSYKTPTSTPPFKFLFVGIYEPRKRVMEIIHAFHKLNREDTQLTFIGYGSLEKQMKAYVTKHQLQDQIHVLDPIANDQLTPYYQSHHCYISVSTSETFGITVAEAMSCGMHVLYSKSGGPEHFVSPVGTKLVEDTSPKNFSQNMSQMINTYNPEDSKLIRNHVDKNLSSKSVVEKIIAQYQNALSSSHQNIGE